jgi:hypothetical protein
MAGPMDDSGFPDFSLRISERVLLVPLSIGARLLLLGEESAPGGIAASLTFRDLTALGRALEGRATRWSSANGALVTSIDDTGMAIDVRRLSAATPASARLDRDEVESLREAVATLASHIN